MSLQTSKERLAAVAARQCGRLSRAQLRVLGVNDNAIQHWCRQGRLIRVLPKVYAVGHSAPSHEADLWAAVLYAGPNAMLSHMTGAHWRELIDHPPDEIEVCTPLKRRSIPGAVRVYGRRQVTRVLHRGMPVAPVPQILLDLAASSPQIVVRRALSQLDYRNQLDIEALEAMCGSGRPGSAALRAAIAVHQPRLAYANGELERRLIVWCERWQVPLPRMNVRLHGILVDAYWPEHGLVVEMDGDANHSSRAQRTRDRRNELVLRSHGLRVVRYDWSLLHDEPAAMHADLTRHLSAAEPPDSDSS